MRREYKLKSRGTLGLLSTFGWDPETGALDGPQAKVIQLAVSEAMKRGSVIGHTDGTVFRIHDPLHSEAQMALVLAQYWILTTELADACPKVFKHTDLMEATLS